MPLEAEFSLRAFGVAELSAELLATKEDLNVRPAADEYIVQEDAQDPPLAPNK